MRFLRKLGRVPVMLCLPFAVTAQAAAPDMSNGSATVAGTGIVATLGADPGAGAPVQIYSATLDTSVITDAGAYLLELDVTDGNGISSPTLKTRFGKVPAPMGVQNWFVNMLVVQIQGGSFQTLTPEIGTAGASPVVLSGGTLNAGETPGLSLPVLMEVQDDHGNASDTFVTRFGRVASPTVPPVPEVAASYSVNGASPVTLVATGNSPRIHTGTLDYRSLGSAHHVLAMKASTTGGTSELKQSFSADADGDGLPNWWEMAYSLDAGDASDGTLDADGDGASNRQEYLHGGAADNPDSDGDGLTDGEELAVGTHMSNPDSDGDGMADGAELVYGFDPLDSADGMADSDGDGVTNADELADGTDPTTDDQPPVIEGVAATATLDAEATYTAYDVLAGVTATDGKDGDLTNVIQVSPRGPYQSGTTAVTLSVTDAAGNTGEAATTLEITPLVYLDMLDAATEGDASAFEVSLSGPAVDYPVIVGYDVGGTSVYNEDHDLQAGSVELNDTDPVSVPFSLLTDSDFAEGETLEVTLTSVVNGALSPTPEQVLTINDDNVAPTVTVEAYLDGAQVSSVTQGETVTLIASVRDANPGDSHQYAWSSLTSSLLLAGMDTGDLQVDTSNVSPGVYTLDVQVIDDGVPSEMATASFDLSVVSDPVTTDSDGDGVVDAEDPDAVDNLLATSGDQTTYLIESEPGTLVKMGSLALQSGSVLMSTNQFLNVIGSGGDFETLSGGESDGVYDLVVESLSSTGTSASLVVALQQPIPADASLMIYDEASGSLLNFYSGGADAVLSSPGSNGSCPAAGNDAYVSGLTEGHSCVQVKVADGGTNDGDATSNAAVSLTTTIVAPPVPKSKSSGSGGDSGGGGGTVPPWLLAGAVLFALLRRLGPYGNG